MTNGISPFDLDIFTDNFTACWQNTSKH